MRAFVLLLAVVACSDGFARGAEWESHAAALEGRWAVRFEYADHSSVSGSIELTPNHAIDRTYPRMGLPTNYGTYAVPFEKLGGSPSGRRVPALVAGVAGDSMFVVFETDREGFSMHMRGRLSGDSIGGTWAAVQTRGTIAAGTFIMTRR